MIGVLIDMKIRTDAPLEVLESRQAQRLEHLATLQALVDAKQREIENVRAATSFDHTVNKFARTHRFLEVVR
jgi:uncharacterized coiled-coil protein SlyX